MLIHCTQKLLAEIPDRLVDSAMIGDGWHANLLHIDRRKCVLFTHDTTLYSVFAPGLKKPEFEHLEAVFGERLFKALLWEGFPQNLIEKMLDASRNIGFARSSSRSVLGSMNDIRFQIEVHIAHDGGLANVDLAELHHRINRTPLSAVNYRYPVEGFQEYLVKV